MGWFQSEKMKYIQIIMHKDAAHQCVSKLGELEGGDGAVQFTDLNTNLTLFQREYIPQIKRCDEMERMLRYFKDECAKSSIEIEPTEGPWNDAINRFQDMLDSHSSSPEAMLQKLEEFISNEYNSLATLNQQFGALTRANNELAERTLVLQKCNEWGPDVYGQAQGALSGATQSQGLLGNEGNSSLSWQYLCGVVPSEERIRFERMIFRATRGNVFIKFWDCQEEHSSIKIEKHVFIMVFKSARIESKLRKLCAAHHATTYQVSPDQHAENRKGLEEAQHDSQQQQVALNRVADSRDRVLRNTIAVNLEVWRRTVRLQKATYHTLDLFKSDKEVMNSPLLTAEGWVIASSYDEVESHVKDAHRHLGEDLGLVVHLYDHHPEPPTHFKLNKYTRVFQDLVDTYGVARYREINPAVFTAVTFPFLFGVMYGDIGHGTCLLLAGLYLILTEKQREGKKMDELMSGLHGGRYMLLMMGVFAVYCGLVYNDMFALSLNAMPGGTQWEYICPCKGETDVFQKFPNGFNCHSDTSPLPKGPNDSYRCSAECCLTDPKKEGVIPKDSVSRAISSTTPEMGVMGGFAEGNVYPFGLDPMWKGTANEGMYFNSFKMKISVILGISQMVFGICLKGLNAVFVMMNTNDKHAKKHAWYDFMHEFVPQMLFACCLFVYMMWMIVYKWTINWQDRMWHGTELAKFPNATKFKYCTNYDVDCVQPPSLINALIDIALNIGNVAEPMYNSQATTQTYLLLIAVLAVPWMLLVKPILLKADHKKELAAQSSGIAGYNDDTWTEASPPPQPSGGGGGHGHGGEFNFGEIVIHQAIETIEFVLGMISNTASYLRLWALSLAHSELALVFWDKVMKAGLPAGPFATFVAFAIWAAITIGVLLLMDVLECFLHALRLHWVEFQNKFYKADGYKFQPLGFAAIVQNLEA